jgi:hypothetical protein
VHKSFHSQADAAAFVAGANPVAAAGADRKRKPRSRSRSPGAPPRRRLHAAPGDDAADAAPGEAVAPRARASLHGFTHTLQFDGGARCVALSPQSRLHP